MTVFIATEAELNNWDRLYVWPYCTVLVISVYVTIS